MSGPAALPGSAADLVLDLGVLSHVPTCEWHGWSAVAACGGIAVVPWRSQARAASAARITHQVDGTQLSGFAQAVVRIGKQMQMVHSGSSYCSQSDLALTFGLGKDGVVPAVDIEWPSGARQHLANVKVDQILNVTEASK